MSFCSALKSSHDTMFFRCFKFSLLLNFLLAVLSILLIFKMTSEEGNKNTYQTGRPARRSIRGWHDYPLANQNARTVVAIYSFSRLITFKNWNLWHNDHNL